MESLIKKVYKENKTDILKYGSKFYKLKYKEMNNLNLNKKDIKNNIKFIINPKVKITSNELSVKSLKEELYE